jgi:hypothetical protein
MESRFPDGPFGLSFLFPHRASDNTARTKILDRTPCCNREQLDRLCNWIANVTAWLYSSKPILHLRLRVQHSAMAQGADTHKSSSVAGTRWWFGRGRSSGGPWYSHRGHCQLKTLMDILSWERCGSCARLGRGHFRPRMTAIAGAGDC